VRIERVVLEDHGEIAVLRCDVVHDTVADVDLTAARFLQPGDDAQRGRLAAARRPEQNEELAVVDLQVQIVKGRELAEALVDALEQNACQDGAS
jgi:hypothetical protein